MKYNILMKIDVEKNYLLIIHYMSTHLLYTWHYT